MTNVVRQPPPLPKAGSPYFAIGSVAAGAIFCLPPLAILGVVLALLAFRSSVPQFGGHAAATIGLLLSSLGLLLIGWTVFVIFALARPVGDAATAFVTDLSNGAVASAMGRCERTVTNAEVQAWSEQVRSLGPIQRVTPTSPLFQSCVDHSGERRFAYTIDVRLITGSGEHNVALGLLRRDGRYVVVMFGVRGR